VGCRGAGWGVQGTPPGLPVVLWRSIIGVTLPFYETLPFFETNRHQEGIRRESSQQRPRVCGDTNTQCALKEPLNPKSP